MTVDDGKNFTPSDLRLVPFPPRQWKQLAPLMWPTGSTHKAATVWQHELSGLQVLRSLSTVTGGSKWIHISVARHDRLPTWVELKKVKDEFLGPNEEAYQVLAAEKDHVNYHKFCLHLWARADRLQAVANLRSLENEEAI